MSLDLTCRCKAGYTCVACKVKRGDYRDWMNPPTLHVVRPPKASCSVPSCERIAVLKTLCYSHYDAARARIVRARYSVVQHAG